MKGFLPDQTRICRVHLRTKSIDGLLPFYGGVLGFKASYGPGSRAMLSAAPGGPPLLVFSEDRHASPRPRRTTGLYHFALRYPTRNDLARIYGRVVEAGYAVDGASDHGVSEAIYLSDPDGNGVELYVDRPPSTWRWQRGEVGMVTARLDLENLLASTACRAVAGGPPELGHVHLHVADLGAAERFYHEFLGLTVTQRSYPGALFFAAGGYHHHIATNIWAGDMGPAANSVGLISYRLEVPIPEILYCLSHRAPLLGYDARSEKEGEDFILYVRDVNGNWLELQAARNATLTDPRSSWAGCPERLEALPYSTKQEQR